MERRLLRPIPPKPLPPPPLIPMGATASGNVLSAARKRGRQDHQLLLAAMSSKRERDATRRVVVPVERDLISKLGKSLQVPKVIKPRAVRPLHTTIYIDASNSNTIAVAIAAGGGIACPDPKTTMTVSNKTAREVEAELDLPGALPAIVSGRDNRRVHVVNDAYNAMIGQPVCPWLDILPGGAAASAARRINGRVALHVCSFRPALRLPATNAGAGPDAAAAFPCMARITWEEEGGGVIASLTVPCAVEYLIGGRSGEYRFIWR